MSGRWTPEARARQAELIRTWKPWTKSTGPRTAEGKAKAAQRGFKGGHRQRLRDLRRMLHEAIRQHAAALGL